MYWPPLGSTRIFVELAFWQPGGRVNIFLTLGGMHWITLEVLDKGEGIGGVDILEVFAASLEVLAIGFAAADQAIVSQSAAREEAEDGGHGKERHYN